tara:strand:- start:1193 stop:1552 length:360 start_codon:yes stop_codon:yes gene_type:complete
MLAIAFYWYWQIKVFDLFMHTLGGFFIGIATLYIYYFSGYVKEPKHENFIFILLMVLGMVSLVAIMWEFFEFIVDSYISSKNYLQLQGGLNDTLGDFLFDLFGGFISVILYTTLWKTRA